VADFGKASRGIRPLGLALAACSTSQFAVVLALYLGCTQTPNRDRLISEETLVSLGGVGSREIASLC
jgi:hypothetical protein